MGKGAISSLVIHRMPRYYRFLGDLQDEGITRISSRELAERMNLTASQIRQDFNCFGGFGQQGYGYNVDVLRDEIAHILGLDRSMSAILIGVGNIGRAVVKNVNFEAKGFTLIGMFDEKESVVGQVVKNTPVRHISTLDEFCRENKPAAAILCLPKAATKQIAEQLINLGVKGFLNFSSYDIYLDYPDAIVENVHFEDGLMTLSYRLHEEEDNK
ncbi:MAG: redox-sensing transcriptional repressor Rex [Clostridia bacterium]|nr:redox-sensing transcriptional repressor Rex [Clostridia bacterium]